MKTIIVLLTIIVFLSLNVKAQYSNNPWKWYTSANSRLSTNYVSSVAVDNNNRVWVITQEGIQYLKRNKWIMSLKFHDVQTEYEYKKLICAKSGVLYAVLGNKMFEYRDKKWFLVSVKDKPFLEPLIINSAGVVLYYEKGLGLCQMKGYQMDFIAKE